MAAGNFQFNFSTLTRQPGWTAGSVTQKAEAVQSYDWNKAQTAVNYARDVAAPVVGRVNTGKASGWITSFKGSNDVFIRMANGGTAVGEPTDLLKTYLKQHPGATLESIPDNVLVGTTIRRATENEDPNSVINQVDREVAALHKNHPDEVLSPLERAQLVRKYGQDALASYDKVYPASATLAATSGSDLATVGHPQSYAGNIRGSAATGGTVIGATPPTPPPVSPGPDSLTDLQNKVTSLNVYSYNPADMIRAVTERTSANARAQLLHQQQSDAWKAANPGGAELGVTPWSGWGVGPISAPVKRRLAPAFNYTNAPAPLVPPTNSFQQGYQSFWGA